MAAQTQSVRRPARQNYAHFATRRRTSLIGYNKTSISLATKVHHSPTRFPAPPSFPLADTEIVTYLEEQGLARHNITIRSPPARFSALPLSPRRRTRLAHIVKWIKPYGDTQGDLKLEETTGNRGGNRENELTKGIMKGTTKQKREPPRSETGTAREPPHYRKRESG